jgi:uncharacterized protein
VRWLVVTWVAFGREGSGTYVTARLLFKVSEVVPGEMVPIDKDEALRELKAGRIDATSPVAGYPVKLFTEQHRGGRAGALLPIRHKRATQFYSTVEIPAGAYT